MTDLERLTSGEREAAVARLHTALESGSLGLDDFSDRLRAAYAARTPAELALTVNGLAEPPAANIREHTSVGTIKHSGRWRLPAYTAISTGVGSVKLDLRDAEMAGPEASIAVRAGAGTIKVWVPASWRVEVYGNSTVGGRYVEENQLPADTPAPTLRLRLDTTLGTVKVYRVDR